MKKLKSESWRITSISIFTRALFPIFKWWKQPEYPSTDERVKKKKKLHTVEYYSTLKKENHAIWDNTNEMSEQYAKWNKPVTERQILYDSIYIQNSQSHRISEWSGGCQRLEHRIGNVLYTYSLLGGAEPVFIVYFLASVCCDNVTWKPVVFLQYRLVTPRQTFRTGKQFGQHSITPTLISLFTEKRTKYQRTGDSARLKEVDKERLELCLLTYHLDSHSTSLEGGCKYFRMHRNRKIIF